MFHEPLPNAMQSPATFLRFTDEKDPFRPEQKTLPSAKAAFKVATLVFVQKRRRPGGDPGFWSRVKFGPGVANSKIPLFRCERDVQKWKQKVVTEPGDWSVGFVHVWAGQTRVADSRVTSECLWTRSMVWTWNMKWWQTTWQVLFDCTIQLLREQFLFAFVELQRFHGEQASGNAVNSWRFCSFYSDTVCYAIVGHWDLWPD